MHKWIPRIVIAAALVGAIVVLRLTVFAPDPIPVQVVTVARGQVEETVTNSRAGTVMARQRARLSPDTGGRVVAILHREGEQVRAGEALLRLDDSAQRAQLVLAERDLEAAEAKHEQACLEADRAQRELTRYRDLAVRQFVSADFLDSLESAAAAAAAACDATRAGVERARAQIAATQTDLEKTVLRAPFDGVVADLSVEVGEWITPSPPGLPMPSVIDLINPGSIYISAPMDEVDSARIHPGQPARVTIDPFPGRHFTGQVVRVAPYVLDVLEQNRTVEIEVELDDAAFASTLLPGTSADVEAILSIHDDVLRIPTPTLLEGGTVLVVEEGRLVERTVQTGLRNWDYTEITKGLAVGDQVVTSLDRPEVKAGVRVVVEGTVHP